MKRSLALLALPLVAATALVSCGSDDDATTTPADTTADSTATEESMPASDLDLDGTSWTSTGADGQELVEGSTVALSFADGSISINAGCNTMFGGYTLDGSTLQAPTLAMTMMACDQPLMDQDAWLSALFSGDPTVAVDTDELTVTGGDGTSVTFAAAAAGEAATLEGTRWVVDGLVANQAVSTVPIGAVASLTITDGTAAVEAGCNTGSASVEVTDTTLTFGPMALTRMACPQPQMDLEAAVTSVLDGEVAYVIDGDTLQLRKNTDAGEIGLDLVAS